MLLFGMMRKGQGDVMMLVLLIVVIIETIFLYNYFYEDVIILNFDFPELVDVEKMRSEVKLNVERRFIPPEDVNLRLLWRNFNLNEDARYIHWRECKNVGNVADIYLSVRIDGLYECFDEEVMCPDYTCKVDLIKGENKEFYDDIPLLFKIPTDRGDLSFEKEIVFNQRLERDHEVEVCCTSGYREGRFCKRLELRNFC
jgi:hypothetical protein